MAGGLCFCCEREGGEIVCVAGEDDAELGEPPCCEESRATHSLAADHASAKLRAIALFASPIDARPSAPRLAATTFSVPPLGRPPPRTTLLLTSRLLL